jgi:hypothetical protein
MMTRMRGKRMKRLEGSREELVREDGYCSSGWYIYGRTTRKSMDVSPAPIPGQEGSTKIPADRVAYSPAFLAQLPKLEDMQIDNPSLPLRVVSSLINNSHTTSTSIFGEEQKRRKETTSRLISLVS